MIIFLYHQFNYNFQPYLTLITKMNHGLNCHDPSRKGLSMKILANFNFEIIIKIIVITAFYLNPFLHYLLLIYMFKFHLVMVFIFTLCHQLSSIY
jgi:hypothetical protein